ncbi:hypothetical protein DITRI_Ditri16bG0101300 [Diplodiscus trichospermus]
MSNGTNMIFWLVRFSERGRLFSIREARVIQTGPNGTSLHSGCNWLIDCLELAAKTSRRGVMIVTPIVTASVVAAKITTV